MLLLLLVVGCCCGCCCCCNVCNVDLEFIRPQVSSSLDIQVEVNLLRARAQVSYAEATTTAEELVDEIESIGFDASILESPCFCVVFVVLVFFLGGVGRGGAGTNHSSEGQKHTKAN